MEFFIDFTTEYADKRRDIRAAKMRTFKTITLVFGIMFAMGIFITFLVFRGKSWKDDWLGWIFIGVGALGLLYAPFGSLFQRVNNGLCGKVHVCFLPQSNKEWLCVVFANVAPEPVYNAEISLAERGKTIFTVMLKNGNELMIPVSQLDETAVKNMTDLCAALKQLRIDQTKKNG